MRNAMVVIDGVRYRAEDAPEIKAAKKPANRARRAPVNKGVADADNRAGDKPRKTTRAAK